MAAGRVVPVHYLRANHTEWSPPVLVGIDTETRRVGDSAQALRCWVASVVARPNGRTDWQSRVDADGTTAKGLASTLDSWSRSRQTMWVYAHNLSFDLAVTRLPVELHAIGWEVTDFALDGRSPWMRLAKGRSRITLADSWSWLPTSLGIIGGQVRIEKPILPDDADDAQTWLTRCRSDVDILMAAMGQLMDWWATTGRGRWTVTGAASGWNAYRHTESPFRVVIDPNPEGVAHERRAIYGGKRWVGQVGSLTPGQYAEADFSRAYTTIAAHLPLPHRRMRAFTSMSIDDERICSERWGIIAEVTLDADRPQWPKRASGRVWYPVGRFRTTLAGPEIAYARERGSLVAIHAGYTYQLTPHMAPWAEWCLQVADEASVDTPSVVRMAAKQWGRSVIGKWAQRGYQRVQLGPAPTDGWGYESAWMADSHSRASIVDIGGWRHMCYPDGDGENTFPAVLAFVESHVRVRLNRVIDAIGQSAFVQADTDGLLCSVAGLIRRARLNDTRDAIQSDRGDFLGLVMDKISTITGPLTLRIKRTYSRVEVIGPQHIRLDGMRRFSGIPASGEELSDGTIGAWTWPKLSQQMSERDNPGYVRRFQRYRVPRSLAAGWVTEDGTVRPVEWAIDASGREYPVQWWLTRWAEGGETLSVSQTPDVVRLHRDAWRPASDADRLEKVNVTA